MWQFLYIIAFAFLAVLAIGNLMRNLFVLGLDSRRPPSRPTGQRSSVSHPELLDEEGRVINEPLLVMRSMSVDDAREHLDSLYRQSPGSNDETLGEV
ncbi:DUF2973 domain-containing protein [Lyngbya confervoides BDU141951]|uniref:DUF2973 domain-containing protein n=1 Tax=Lyngbya confervoides BDU141951 TaxID=1574623 RepID=A0ABD4T5K2_9CYAN|nr:DUF2973 domain-containing protein [Lyngbya confervoides]MCM1983809.1 DUF2973 domain-containing protein [Lyngbya confervoides BDU141951]